MKIFISVLAATIAVSAASDVLVPPHRSISYSFPRTGTQKYHPYGLCVKGAKYASASSDTNMFFDPVTTSFDNGTPMFYWQGASLNKYYATDLGDACKGGIYLQNSVNPSSQDGSNNKALITLDATLADGEATLTVCGLVFYPKDQGGSWPEDLPSEGFTRYEKSFSFAVPKEYSTHFQWENDSLRPQRQQRMSDIYCKDFVYGQDSSFVETKKMPAPVTYSFPPASGGNWRSPYGVCVKGAQWATLTSTTNLNYEKITHNFRESIDLWHEPYVWEEPRRGYGANEIDGLLTIKRYGKPAKWYEENPCKGGIFFQPQSMDLYYKHVQGERAPSNYYNGYVVTIDAIPEDGETSVKICGIVYKHNTFGTWGQLYKYGFVSEGEDPAWKYHVSTYCQDFDQGPTESPSAAPTDRPSESPSAAPTDPPSESPSAAPTDPPSESPICAKDIVLVKQEGVAPLPNDVIQIVRQDTTSVTVSVSQNFTPSSSTIDEVFVQYKTDIWSLGCFEEPNMVGGESFEITIACTKRSQIGNMKLWIVDDLSKNFLSEMDDAVVPNCCYSTTPENTPAVSYVFDINCVTACSERIS